MTSLLALSYLALFALAAVGLGAALARLLRLAFEDLAEWACLSAALGAGALSSLGLALGLLGLFGTASTLALLVPCATFGVFALLRLAPPRAVTSSPRWLRRLLLGAVALCALGNVVGALAPPTFIDALLYHLTAPRLYLEAGRLVELPWLWQTYSPFGTEMLFTLGLSLAGPELATLLHLGLGLTAAAAAYLVGRRLSGEVAGLVAAAAFYCTAMTAWQSTSAFIELALATYGPLSIYGLLRWDEGRGRGWLVAAALLGGFAACAKLPGVLWPVLGGAVIVGLALRRRLPISKSVTAILVYGVISAALVLPWYVRTYLWTGNPVFPFAAGVFGPNEYIEGVSRVFSGYGKGHGFLDFVLAPWRLAVEGIHFDHSEFLGPLPLLAAPLLFWRALAAPSTRPWLFVVGASFVAWFLGLHNARYLVPLQPIALGLVAEAALALAARGRFAKVLSALLVAPALVVGVGTALAYDAQFAPVVFGRESRDAYLARKAWYYPAYRWAAASTPPEARVLTSLGATFHLERSHALVRPTEAVSPERLDARLREGRFTHLLIHDGDVLRSARALGPRLRLLGERSIELATSRSFGGSEKMNVLLFEVASEAPPASPR